METFIQSLIIGYSGAIMPGSILTYVLNKSIKFGAKSGFIIALGHALLEMLIVILIFLGIGEFISSPLAQIVIGLLGGVVLIFMGSGMLKDGISGNVKVDLSVEANMSYGNLLAGGALLSATNPYFLVWWATIGLGLLMKAYYSFGILGIILVYLGHITSDLTWYIFISALVGKTRNFINIKVYRTIIIILGVALFVFGTNFFVSAFKLIKNFSL